MDAQRFHSKYIEDDVTGCWLWKGAVDQHGGRFWAKEEAHLAHRWAYTNLIAAIPKNMFVMHRCGKKSCVNPQHLYLVAPHENVATRVPTYWQRTLTEEAVRDMRASTAPLRDLAEKWKCSVQSVSNVRNFKTYKSVR